MNGYIFGCFGCSDWKGGREDDVDLFGCSLVHIHIQQVSFMGFVLGVSRTKYANSDVCRFFLVPPQIQGPVLVEDTCLCFNAFDELPGPYVYVCSLFRFDHLLNGFCEQSTYLPMF